jgi:MoaA/NifB/PqqE/SkfB family radical SAM enzyme
MASWLVVSRPNYSIKCSVAAGGQGEPALATHCFFISLGLETFAFSTRIKFHGPRIHVTVGKGPSPVNTSQLFQAWGKILRGEQPSLSIEITKECPLRCPGCYAYDNAHLGGGQVLRDLHDRRGQALVDGVLQVVDRLKPLHLSIVGGDPLVRYRELEQMVPLLLARGLHVQIVTSAFRAMTPAWANLERLLLVVSIDGLQPEHDARRAPATYDRILKNIAGHRVTVHCTITGQMMKRPGYLAEFLEFWTPRPEIKKVWFSMFTPQIGDEMPEILSREERHRAVEDLVLLRKHYPKLDMAETVIRQFVSPPHRPQECVFALTTQTLSADLTTEITPCQFGGNPDCSSCGCIGSMYLAAVAAHKVKGVLPVGALFKASIKIGQTRARYRRNPKTKNPLPILQATGASCASLEHSPAREEVRRVAGDSA